MPVSPTYPGVYIEEVPSGVRSIAGVPTSVAAFVDVFNQGPRDEAVQIFNFGDFEREFGGLDNRSEASYGIQQFFLNGGGLAWVVRVANGAGTAEQVVRTEPLPAGAEVFRAKAGRRIRGAAVDNPGKWGDNLRIEIDYDTSDPASRFNLTVREVVKQGDRTAVARTESYRNLTMRVGDPDNALSVVNEASKMVQLSRDAGWGAVPATTFRPAATGTLGGNLPAAEEVTALTPRNLTITARASDNTTTAFTHAAVPNFGAAPAGTNFYVWLLPLVQNLIRSMGAADPRLAGAAVRLIGAGTTASPYRYHVLAGQGGDFDPGTTLSFSGTVAGALRLNVPANVQQYLLPGGSDGSAPDANTLKGSPGAKTGLYALDDADLFNLLCIPAAAKIDAGGLTAVVSSAIAYCEQRRAFMIVDVPETVADFEAMQTWMLQNDSLRHKNAAVYFPRPIVPDPLNNNRGRNVAASGMMAGLYARTDGQRGVWKAPAGTDATLRNVSELKYVLTDPQNGELNPLGINSLRNFPVYGNVSWGARTLDGSDQKASEWKYVPVRRTALYLEESLYRGLKWVVFEPNDEPLWGQIRLNVGAFMQGLFRQGAFQGKSPREAYFVKCDSETTTQADINLGIVNIVVGFAPLKPAEFVIIKLQQIAGQIEV